MSSAVQRRITLVDFAVLAAQLAGHPAQQLVRARRRRERHVHRTDAEHLALVHKVLWRKPQRRLPRCEARQHVRTRKKRVDHHKLYGSTPTTKEDALI